jgi:hypothetical protein
MSFLKEYGKHFESSSSGTPEWNSFYRKGCNFFKKTLKDVAEDIQMSKGHFYFTGFFTVKSTKKIFYFSISDVRFFPNGKLLIRTATDYKDYTGGSNNYLSIDNNLGNALLNFIKGGC